MSHKLKIWRQTSAGLLAFCLIELAITYGFASLAIDRGNFLWYLLAMVFLIGALQNLVKLIGSLYHGPKRT